jgi:hypothetical protein
MRQATFLLSNAFLLVNFREALDQGDSQYVGDENGCHGLEEGNRSVEAFHGLGS